MKSGYTLVNEGTTTLASNNIIMGSGTVLRNRGTFDANAEGTEKGIVVQPGSSPEPRIVNEGRFQKTAGAGTTEIIPPFENGGAIVENSGKLKILHKVSVSSSTPTPHHAECGDPVDCGTGNFTQTQTDLEIGGRGVGLDLTRTYSAQAAAAGSLGIFGYGWTNSFGGSLVSEESGAKERLTEASGATVTFTKSGASWVAPLWSQDTLAGSAEVGFTLILSDQTKEAFSGAGRLETVTDRNGNETALAYNGSGKLETITDPSGRKITLTYNAEGLVEKAKDPMGHEVKYTYEYESKNLKSVTLPGEASPSWQFKYDASHRMTSFTDGRGGKTTNEYDSSSRVISQTDPMERKATWEYAPFHTTITDKATGAVTDEWFNSNNQPYSITRGFGTAAATTESFTYTAAGLLASRTDGNGHATTYEYDAAGNRIKETDPEGDETKRTYNEAHQVLTETQPNGEKTTIVRNANGDPETASRPAPESKTQTVSYEYGPHGEVKTMTNPLGHAWRYEYDSNGDLKAETDPEGDKRTWAYDEDSRIVSTVSPRGNEEGAEAAKYTTSIERDIQGRPIKIIDPLGGTTKYAYDLDGNVESITDPNGHKTKFTYDADNERTKVERPSGSVEEIGYDGAGQVTSQTDGDEHKTTYLRNVLEEPVETNDPLERKTSRTFDAAGNLKTRTDPDGRVTTYGYDKADRLKEISYSAEAGQDASFEYEEDGNLTKMTDGTGENTYKYDQLDRLVASEDGNGETVGWEYDLAEEPIGLTYPNGTSISRAYDEAGRLESVTDWLGHTTSFSYNADSALTGTVFPIGTGDIDEYAWDRADRMSTVAMKDGGETLASLSYARDPAGQIESVSSKGLPGTEEESFEYDEDERLKAAGGDSFEYDAADNLTKAPGTTNTFDKASEIESATGAAFTFDKEGERTKQTPSSGPATSYGYDQAGELTAVERAEEGETPAIAESFAYDETGLLASTFVGLSTRHIVWDITESPEVLLSDGEDSYVYGPDGLAIEQISSEEAPTYLHHDQLGSTRLLTDATGEAAATFTFGVYGTLAGKTGSATTVLGYAGQYTAGQSGVQYLRARFYDPATAQFLTRDPIENITRLPYGYTKGNPAGRIDPSGLCGVSTAGDFLESINPISEENCAYEAASSASEAVDNISMPSTREAAEAEVGFFDGGTAGLTKYARELFGIGNGGLGLCGSTYEGSGIAGAVVFSVLAPETPEGALRIASRFPDASLWVARHGDEVNQVKDVVEEVLRHVLGK
jgi:RHS repeat-associated protein